MDIKYIVALVMSPLGEEAERLARTFLEQKKIACANIFRDVNSLFWWKGKIETAKECFMFIKTRALLLADVIKTVKAFHSYEVPEIIALPIIGGNSDYLNGLKKRLQIERIRPYLPLELWSTGQ